MDLGIIFFIIFILILVLLIYLNRDKVEIGGVILIFKTKKFRNFIIHLALKYEGFWRTYFNLGIISAFFMMCFGIFFVIDNAIKIFYNLSSAGLALVLPFPTSTFSYSPGLLLVPPWYWIIAIVIIIFPHEISHGIALALNKLKIKSLGAFLLFFLIPGAFVEPNEKQLKKAKKIKKLQIYAAGSFSNLLVAFIFILLLHITLASIYEYNGIYYNFPGVEINKSEIIEMKNLSNGFIELITKNNTYLITSQLFKQQENKSFLLVYEDCPAIRNNLSGTIKKIDSFIIYNQKDIPLALSKYKPNDSIEIETSEGKYNITLANKNGKAYLGIITYYSPLLDFLFPLNNKNYKIKFEELNLVETFILQLLSFIIAVCIGVAIANMLPIKPLDGGFILETITNRKFANIISIIFLFLLIYNIIGVYL